MKHLDKILVMVFIFALSLQGFAQEKDSITWIESDFPPVWIFEGPDKGKGGADLIQELLMGKLDQYEHIKITTNNTRFHKMAQGGDKVCSCATFKTEDREKFMYFNKIPSSFIFANGIITKRSKSQFFGNAQSISLDGILQNQELILGLGSDRKYGSRIDSVLKKYENNKNIYRRASSDLTKGLVTMLLSDRVDYLIGFDWELQYLVRKNWSAEKADQLIFLPIQETTPYLISYIACAKTPWGQEVVRQIDDVLEKVVEKEEYRNIWGQWMSNKELYNKLYDDVFLKEIKK